MNDTPAPAGDQNEPGLYELRLQGHLDDRWASWFAGLTITQEDHSETLLTGMVVDQAALYQVRVITSLLVGLRGRHRVPFGCGEQAATEFLFGLPCAAGYPLVSHRATQRESDQAKRVLHGVLRKMRDLGLPLVSVIRVKPKQANGPDVNTGTDQNRSLKCLSCRRWRPRRRRLPQAPWGSSPGPRARSTSACSPRSGVSDALLPLGGLVFGIATLRARILSRWAASVLTIALALAPTSALLPPELQPLVAVPIGLGLAWLGYALWSERREQAADPIVGRAIPQLG